MVKLKKFELSLLDDQRIEFDIESDKGNAHGSVPSYLILTILNQILDEQEETILQRTFSNILIEIFKPVTDFIQRYGLNDSAWFVKRTIKDAINVFEQNILKYRSNRVLLWIFQKQKYYGW